MAATLQRGHIIQDEGTALTQRPVLDFVGAGVTVTDVGGKTVAEITGGGSGSVTSVTAADTSVVVEGTAADPEVRTGTLDAIAAAQPPVAAVSLNGQKITGLGTPTAASDAVTKAYADALAAGLNVKLSVKAATTANITLSGEQTIDGTSVLASDRVLVKNQTLGQNNGIYVASAGAWARSTDADISAEVTAGMFTFIEGGTTQGDTGWVLTTNNPITLDTTVLVFTQFSGAGSGIPQTIFDAKGDLIVATAADTAARLAVGANRLALIADSAQTAGVKWSSLVGVTTAEWYVDAAAASGGDGRSAATAFTTFAAAMSACANRDVIYVCSDLNEDITINKEDVRVVGVGRPVLFGSGSSSIGARTVNVTAQNVTLENFLIWGHAAFKGVHLALNFQSDYFRVINVSIDGTGGSIGTNTFYPTAPGTGTKTGLGGVGILCHHAENGMFERPHVANCSIGIALGTWSTKNIFTRILSGGNCQDLVLGMYTGAHTGPATTGAAFGYCLQALAGAEDDHAGGCVFDTWQPVSPVGTASYANPAQIDLVGDQSTSYTGVSGGANIFRNVDGIEGAGTPIIRIGTRGNLFENMVTATGTLLQVMGTHNTFLNPRPQSTWNVYAPYNIFENVTFLTGWLNGAATANYTTFKNVPFLSTAALPLGWSTSTGHWFDRCTFITSSGTPPTIASLGTAPTVTWGEGTRIVTYAATMATDVITASRHKITVTNGTAFTISNPTDSSNIGDTSKIMVTHPITYEIKNSSGGAMGAITWGSKFRLAGAFTNPADTKRRAITFSYDYVDDVWVELSRSAADA